MEKFGMIVDRKLCSLYQFILKHSWEITSAYTAENSTNSYWSIYLIRKALRLIDGHTLN